MKAIVLIAVLLVAQTAFADDPLNQPLDSVGVSGYDTTLCNDKWNTCSNYDRSQFDTRYPGTPLEEISRFPLKETGDRQHQRTYLEDRSTRYGEGSRSDRRDEVLSESY